MELSYPWLEQMGICAMILAESSTSRRPGVGVLTSQTGGESKLGCGNPRRPKSSPLGSAALPETDHPPSSTPAL